MIEKRFKLKDYGYDGWAIEDTTGEIFENDYIEDMSQEQVIDLLNSLNDENEELKKRNNRQAKQLDNIYSLIEQKDWRALSDIIDDFKKCEERLEREERLYSRDVE